jgi:two-component system, LytTR family, sensor kinase
MKKSVVVLLHLGYWFMYLLLLFCIVAMAFSMGENSGNYPIAYYIPRWIVFFSAFAIIPGMIGFYSFYTFLFSRFLERKKIFALCLYGILVSVICALLGELIISLIIAATGQNKGGYLFPGRDLAGIVVVLVIMFLNALANGIVGLVMRGFITSFGDIKLKEDLNKKNYEMELALVKSQINPHFLFNTINNIDVLIEKDAKKASAYLNKLSDIMRFMLYETKTEKIELAKELSYIEKYIELQRIRTSNTNYVNYSVTGDSENLRIAPMLFIPFIENAFKHAENKKVENAIDIKIAIEKDKIIFECANNYSKETQVRPDQSGLGNELIKKRLNLLYQGKHSLDISNQNNIYKVKLTITE